MRLNSASFTVTRRFAELAEFPKFPALKRRINILWGVMKVEDAVGATQPWMSRRAAPSPSETPDHWADTGCSLAPSCLNCPLPVCRYDLPIKLRPVSAKKIESDAEIWHSHYIDGLSFREIAALRGITTRSVKRAVDREIRREMMRYGAD